MGCFCAIDPEDDDCVFEWQLVSGRHYTRGTISKGYGFTFRNKKICHVVEKMFDEIKHAKATNYLKDDQTNSDMTVDRLRRLQKELWDERVQMVRENPNYNIGDPEIELAFVNRGVNKRNFEPSEMEFRVEEFPEIPYGDRPSVETKPANTLAEVS
jgi:hypothetical protein